MRPTDRLSALSLRRFDERLVFEIHARTFHASVLAGAWCLIRKVGGVASDTGAEVFEASYFGRRARSVAAVLQADGCCQRLRTVSRSARPFEQSPRARPVTKLSSPPSIWSSPGSTITRISCDWKRNLLTFVLDEVRRAAPAFDHEASLRDSLRLQGSSRLVSKAMIQPAET
jgi:hypothetical protein